MCTFRRYSCCLDGMALGQHALDFSNWCKFRDWRTFFHRKLEQEPFLRIRRKIHVSVDFRAVKFNNFYWPEMQNVICSLETDTKFHHVP